MAGWEFRIGKKVVGIDLAGNWRVNSMNVLRSLVLSGVGIGVFPGYLVGANLPESRVLAQLQKFAPPAFNAL